MLRRGSGYLKMGKVDSIDHKEDGAMEVRYLTLYIYIRRKVLILY